MPPRPEDTGRGPQKVNLSRRRFGRLKVITWVEPAPGGYSWLCQCKCGRRKVVPAASLITGNTKSCGCLVAEKNARVAGTGGRANAETCVRDQGRFARKDRP